MFYSLMRRCHCCGGLWYAKIYTTKISVTVNYPIQLYTQHNNLLSFKVTISIPQRIVLSFCRMNTNILCSFCHLDHLCGEVSQQIRHFICNGFVCCCRWGLRLSRSPRMSLPSAGSLVFEWFMSLRWERRPIVEGFCFVYLVRRQNDLGG